METQRKMSYTGSRPEIISLVPAEAVDILDVGCSNGELGYFLKLESPARKVVGIEGDGSFCEQARMRLDGVHHADLNNFDWDNAFKPESFDCMIFADVLEHLYDPWGCLNLAIRSLRPGGKVIISVPNIRHISAFFSIFIKGVFPRNPRGLFDNTHIRWFTRKDAIALIMQAGLSIEAYDYRLRFFDRVGGLINAVVSRIFSPFKKFYPVREYLAYQICISAKKQ